MILPDYSGGSIVNLMASIGAVYGWKSPYKQLKVLPAKELYGAKNIVLLLIDGLGYEYILKHGQENKILKKSLIKAKITSVFPSSTSSAVTAFLTGYAAGEHGITGWYTFLKEIGAITTLLPFKTRAGGESLKKLGANTKEIIDWQSFFQKIKVASYSIGDKNFAKSDYYLHSSQGAHRLYCKDINDLILILKNTIRKDNGRKFIYGYWGKFDFLSHHHGINHLKTLKHFKIIDRKLAEFLEFAKDTNTKVIITADHGMIDTKMIKLEQHPKLKETLTLPLCGDHRTVFCYVHPFKRKQFENYIKRVFKNYCNLYKSGDLVKKSIWGKFQANKHLWDRIGDYTLIMKDNYSLRDTLPGENENYPIGNHGGLSKEEMYVPLIII